MDASLRKLGYTFNTWCWLGKSVSCNGSGTTVNEVVRQHNNMKQLTTLNSKITDACSSRGGGISCTSN